jgi:hypothetical protein
VTLSQVCDVIRLALLLAALGCFLFALLGWGTNHREAAQAVGMVAWALVLGAVLLKPLAARIDRVASAPPTEKR